MDRIGRITPMGLLIILLLTAFLTAVPRALASGRANVGSQGPTSHATPKRMTAITQGQAFVPSIINNIVHKANLFPGWCKADDTGMWPVLNIEVPSRVTHSTMYLMGPDRFVLDLKGAILGKTESKGVQVPLAWAFGERVRYSQLDKDIVRVVIDLKRPVTMEVTRTPSVRPNVDRLSISPGPALSMVRVSADDGSLCEARGAQGVVLLSTTSPRIPSIEGSGKGLSIEIPDTWSAVPPDPGTGGAVASARVQSAGFGTKTAIGTAYPVTWDLRQVSDTDWTLHLYSMIESVTIGNDAGDPVIRIKSPGTLSPDGFTLDNATGPDGNTVVVVRSDRGFTAGLGAGGSDSTGALGAVTVADDAGNGTVLTVMLNHKGSATLSKDGDGVLVRFPRGALAGRRIIIDPGHGGTDSGAVGGTGYKEKDAVLDIGLRLKAILQGMQATVLMTRDADTYITLGGRNGFGKDMSPDIFVSLHANAFTNPKPGGTETFHSRTSNAGSEGLARSVQASVVKALGLIDRGVKVDDKLAVTKNRSIPAILHEFCFISNPAEEALLLDPDARQRMAQAVADGIMEFMKGGSGR